MPNAALERFTMQCPRGTVLFEEGQPGDRMYVVQSGRVEIFKKVGESRVLLAQLGPGECIGEMAIIDGQPRSADAQVVEDGVLLVLDRETFEGLVRENGEIAVRIMRKLSQRLREANRQLEAVLTRRELGSAVQLLRDVAGSPDGEGRRPLPAEAGPGLLVSRIGVSNHEARVTWERLLAAGVVCGSEGALLLANEATVEEYLRYLELKQRYDPLTARELSEMTGLPEEEVHRVIRRVLDDRLASAGAGLVDSYRHFLALKRRFEYLDGM